MSARCEHCGSALPEFGGIVADDDRGEIRFGGKFIRNATGQEYTLFRLLLDAKGRTIGKEKILEDLYAKKILSDDEVPDLKIVDVFVCKLRKKLKTLGLEIGTRWGCGYYFVEPPNKEAA